MLALVEQLSILEADYGSGNVVHPARFSYPELTRDVEEGDYGFATGHARAAALLDLPEPSTAIFASNDVTAAAAIKAAHERGLTVPEQVSIAGFDDSDMFRPAACLLSSPTA